MTDKTLARNANDSHVGEPDSVLKLGLTRADGTPLEVSLTRRTISAAPQFTARLLPSGYAYVRFNHFRTPVAKLLKEALAKFKDAPGLILDLRANGGGDGREGFRVAGYFFNEKVSIARVVTRSGKPPSALFGLVSLPKEFQAGERGGQLYSNPVVVLVVSEIAFLSPNGRKLEGEGVTPDKSVNVTLRDLQSGRDVALEEAEAYLKSLRAKGN